MELVKNSSVLFSIEQFVPDSGNVFDPHEFVKNYKRRVSKVETLREELSKILELIQRLLTQTVHEHYEEFIEFNTSLNEIEKKISEKMSSLKNLDVEKQKINNFYQSVLENLNECKEIYRKYESFKIQKEYAQRILFIHESLLFNIKSSFEKYQKTKLLQNFHKISVHLRNTLNYFERIPIPSHCSEEISKIDNIKTICVNKCKKYEREFIQDLKTLIMENYFKNEVKCDEKNKIYILRSICTLKMESWFENIILEEIIPKILIIKNNVINFDDVFEVVTENFLSLNSLIQKENIKIFILQNCVIPYLEKKVFLNPRFKYLFSLRNERKFHYNYSRSNEFLSNLSDSFKTDVSRSLVEINKKWSIRSYFLLIKQIITKNFERGLKKNDLEYSKPKKQFNFFVCGKLISFIKEIFSSDVYIEKKSKDFFVLFLNLIEIFTNWLLERIKKIKIDTTENVLILQLHLLLDLEKLKTILFSDIFKLIHNVIQRQYDEKMLKQVINELNNTKIESLVVVVIKKMIEIFVEDLVIELRKYKSFYMLVAASQKLPVKYSEIVGEIVKKIIEYTKKWKELNIRIEKKYKLEIMDLFFEKYINKYEKLITNFKKRQASLKKINRKSTLGKNNNNKKQNMGVGVGLGNIMKQISLDNKELQKQFNFYFNLEGEETEQTKKLLK